MCGIVGHVRYDADSPSREFVLQGCLDMNHRGPDETGTWTDQNVALGIARLKVIGLHNGEQPAASADGKVVCVANGEIYNHQELRQLLRSRGRIVEGESDVAVVPALYQEFGDDFVHKLNGMFAIALHDRDRARTVLATDRYGKKPLFIAKADRGSSVYFASEIGLLSRVKSVNTSINFDAVDQYLSYRVVPAPHTIFAGIEKLPPATIRVLERERAIDKTYWNPQFCGNSSITSVDAAVPDVEALIRKAVDVRLESDVRLGSMLSGGLDSSLVTAMAQRAIRDRTGRALDTFSVGFDVDRFDEAAEAREVAEFLGTNHHHSIVAPESAIRIAGEILRHVGEPYGFPSAIASWEMYRLAKEYVTVVLTGDGSDEIFCGYARYGRLRATAGSQLPLADRYHSIMADGLTDAMKRTLYTDEFGSKIHHDAGSRMRHRFDQTKDSASDLERAMHVDATSWLSDAQLVKIDRMAMAHSVEPRSPMMDYRLVEYCRKIPSDMSLVGGTEKRILKRVAANYVPQNTIRRRKQELAVPLESWITGRLKSSVQTTLLAEASLDRGYFKPDVLRNLVERYSPSDAYAIWTLYMLEKWHQMAEDEGVSLSVKRALSCR